MNNKAFYILLFAISLMWSCQSEENTEGIGSDIINNPATASGKEESDEIPILTFDDELYDFGSVVQGETVYHSYKFTNTGKADLVISHAQGSCGCTVPEWPKKPIAPGESATIDMEFDSKKFDGNQHKTLTLSANTIPSTTVVAFSGDVIAPKN